MVSGRFWTRCGVTTDRTALTASSGFMGYLPRKIDAVNEIGTERNIMGLKRLLMTPTSSKIKRN